MGILLGGAVISWALGRYEGGGWRVARCTVAMSIAPAVQKCRTMIQRELRRIPRSCDILSLDPLARTQQPQISSRRGGVTGDAILRTSCV
jgi:hypothetical protein